MWTEDDKRFLRSMRIKADAPPTALPPLPRYRAVPTALAGWYRVVDGRRRRPVEDFGPENFKDPRAAAEDVARQMNARQAAVRKPEDEDGA